MWATTKEPFSPSGSGGDAGAAKETGRRGESLFAENECALLVLPFHPSVLTQGSFPSVSAEAWRVYHSTSAAVADIVALNAGHWGASRPGISVSRDTCDRSTPLRNVSLPRCSFSAAAAHCTRFLMY